MGLSRFRVALLTRLTCAALVSAAPCLAPGAPPPPKSATAKPSSAPPGAAQPPGPTTRAARRRNIPAAAPVLPGVPIPGFTAQERAIAQIREIYAADYKDKSYAARRTLALRLIDAADRTQKDTDAKFALLREARDLAAGAGDVPTAFAAVDRLVDTFPMIKLHERTDVLNVAAPVVAQPAANLAVASMCLDLADESALDGDFARADALLNLAAAASVKAKSREMAECIKARMTRVAPLREAYEKVKPALQTLSRTPHDADAAHAVGCYTAFVKGDIDAGLAHLTRSSDAPLSKLAEQDLDTPDAPHEQLVLASAWWDYAQTNGEFGAGMRRRAGFWYAKAMPALDGLDRALAERRLASLAAPASSRPPLPPDVVRLKNRAYRVHIADVTWETAREICEQAGGRLACAETRLEHEFLVKLARGRSLWLGGSAGADGRPWSWLSGNEMYFTFWASGEPAAATPGHHILLTGPGPWKAHNGRAAFVCEWDP